MEQVFFGDGPNDMTVNSGQMFVLNGTNQHPGAIGAAEVTANCFHGRNAMMNHICRMMVCAGTIVTSVGCTNSVVGGPGTGGAGGNGGQAQGSGGSGGSVACALPEPNAVWSRALETRDAWVGKPLVGKQGEMFLAGRFANPITFGPTTLNSNAGALTTFIARLDESGNTLWALSLDGKGEQTQGGRILDLAGHFWIAGGFYDTVNFGGNPLTTNGAFTGFLGTLDAATGAHVSSKIFSDGINGLVADPSGNVFVYGYFDGTTDLGGGPLLSAGATDFFVAKLDPTGNHLWSKRFGDAKNQTIISADTDALGNLWLVGGIEGSVDFGGGAINAPVLSTFVAELDPSGNHLLSKSFGSGSIEQVRVGGDGNVVFHGGGDAIDFGSGPLSGFNFIAKLDAQGNYLWSRDFGMIMVDRIFDIDVDAMGVVFAVGMAPSPMDLAGCAHDGQSLHFLWKFAANGAHQWTKTLGPNVNGWAVTLDNQGRALLLAGFSDSVDLGAGPLVAGSPFTSLLAKFPP